jgi:hypothetical protein
VNAAHQNRFETVEGAKTSHKIPDAFGASAKIVRAIGVNSDTALMSEVVNVPTKMGTAVDNQNVPARIKKQARDSSAGKAGTNNKIINFQGEVQLGLRIEKQEEPLTPGRVPAATGGVPADEL